MAENDVDEPLEDVADEENEASEEKKGLSKSMIIKIAIGVTVLIVLGVGAYFFFASSDDTESSADSMEDDALTETEDEGDAVSDSIAKLMQGNTPTEPEAEDEGDAVSDSIAKLMQGNAPTETTDGTLSDLSSELMEDTDPASESSDMATSTDPEAAAKKLSEVQQETSSLQEENKRMQQRITDLEAQIKQKEMIIQAQDDNNPSPIFDDSMDFQQFENGSTEAAINSVPPPDPKWGEFDRLKK